MQMRYLIVLPLALSLALPAVVQARETKGSSRPPHASEVVGNEIAGKEVAAPPWSSACMTDHGPSECGEPMWIYDSRGTIARYRRAF